MTDSVTLEGSFWVSGCLKLHMFLQTSCCWTSIIGPAGKGDALPSLDMSNTTGISFELFQEIIYLLSMCKSFSLLQLYVNLTYARNNTTLTHARKNTPATYA
jgi:hypothetical protein